MKIFHFDPRTGRRGIFIENRSTVTEYSNEENLRCNTQVGPGVEWRVASRASDADNQPLEYDFPVCFCRGPRLGKNGETVWVWVALIKG